MSYEYVRLSKPEVFYGEKNMLQSQIELLNITKRFREYQKLRREELIFKIALKNKFEEARNTLLAFNKMLPKTPNIKKLKEEKEYALFDKKKLTLEQEIEKIRSKLEKLR